MVVEDESELILPCGKRVGHRDYRRYYKQNLRITAGDPSMAVDSDSSRGRSSLTSKAGMDAVSASAARACAVATKKEAQCQRSYLRTLSKKMMRLGVKQNLFQPHFREQIL